jgi:hypothetical protein
LAERSRGGGDPAIEHLIGGIESGEHSAVVVEDSPRVSHRVFRGVFADAQAIAIFDRSAMVIFPKHRRAIRLYESSKGAPQASLIAEGIRFFRHMRKFLIHSPRTVGLTSLLRRHLTYQLPT